MSIGGGVWLALQRGASIGCESVQIFVKNNMQWFGKPCSKEHLALFQAELKTHKFAAVFGHAGYLINLAAPEGPNREKSLQSLLQEVEFATCLSLPFIVIHPGAHCGQGEDVGIRKAAEALDLIIRATKKSKVRIALENTAGQGSCLGHRLEHLAEIYELVDQPARLAICLDTCHLLAAGYDIRTPKGWNATIKHADNLFGLKQIAAFHLNDSKTPLGSRVDRHADIGEGHIGLEGFRHVVNDARFKNTPGCIETPKSKDLHEDVRNLNALRALVKQSLPTKRASP